MKKNSGEATIIIILVVASIPILMSIVSDFKMVYKQREIQRQKELQQQYTNKVVIINENSDRVRK